jgi:hypothetical protein
MKELWSILMNHLRQIESNYAALGIGVFSLFFLWMSTIVITRLFTMISEIVLAITGQPLG